MVAVVGKNTSFWCKAIVCCVIKIVFYHLFAIKMKRVKQLLLFMLTLVFSLQINAQTTATAPELPKVLPPSPNASALGIVGNIPVGLSTGTLNFGLPLLQLSVGKVSLNVTASYSASGIKVDQIASRLGMGWILDAGGMINRTVRGNADESALYASPPADINLTTPAVKEYLKRVSLNKDHYDAEPDIFSFNFNGYSGKFVLRPTNKTQVVFLNKSTLKIETDFSVNSLKPYTLKVTDPDGMVYYFGGAGATEKSRSTNSGGNNCGKTYDTGVETAWYLTKIQDLNGDYISFSYLPCDIYYDTSASQSILAMNPETVGQSLYDDDSKGYLYPAPGYSSTCINSIISNAVYLNEVTTSKGAVLKFSYAGRSDLDGDKLVSKIEYGLTGATPLKTYDFIYTYGISSSGFNGAYNSSYNPTIFSNRPYLSGITESSKGLTETKKNKFNYYNINDLPPRLAFAQDIYGYYNGQNNSGFIPGPVSSIFSYTPADRYTYGAYANYGMLSKIFYPTGGTDSLIYEPHGVASEMGTGPIPTSYVDAVGGARIARIISHDPIANTDRIKAYRYNKFSNPTLSSAFVFSISPTYFTQVERRITNLVGTAAMFNTYTLASAGGDIASGQFDGSHIYYTDVWESDGADFGNGATLHQYEILTGRPGPDLLRGAGYLGMPSGLSGATAIHEKYQQVFKQDELGNRTKLKEVFLTQKSIPLEVVTSVVGRENYDIDLAGGSNPYDISSYTFESYWNYNDSTKVINYDTNGLNPVTEITATSYGNILHLLPTQTVSEDSYGRKIYRTMEYPHEMVATSNDPQGVYAAMIAKNKISTVIREKEFVQTLQTGEKLTSYFQPFTNIFVPQTVALYNNALTSLTNRIRFHKYDAFGNLQSVSLQDGAKVCYLYSYNNQYPVAEIKDMDYTVIESTLTAAAITSFSLSNPTKVDIANFLSPLTTAFPKAQVSQLSYEPLVGMRSMTDSKGMSSFYEYDDFQRLLNIKDQRGDIVKNYRYNYGANVNTTPTWTDTNVKTCVVVGGSYTGEELMQQVDSNPYSLTYNTNRTRSLGTTGNCQPVIYAKVFEENLTVALRRTKADIVVRFFNDAACTVPISVSGLSVSYQEVDDVYNLINSASIVANGTSGTIATQAIIQENNPFGVPVSYYYFLLLNVPGYTIVY
ncbi:hypothetical protein GM921_00760 [Pedobacter sp. LMG 31464]|uniref:YD repeat-containing protein n=1 Tax=Pedobacter planticolens TaxID=2679964 RepID=A0A923ITQ5_9SPHI|nr:hypothetical protein [Pedobacter planticolens]MBB2144001.1 hypothetical protein [Pedobacter planticolens]